MLGLVSCLRQPATGQQEMSNYTREGLDYILRNISLWRGLSSSEAACPGKGLGHHRYLKDV